MKVPIGAVCPPKRSKGWKNLVSELGEEEANRAFIANNFEIPNAEQIRKFKEGRGEFKRYSEHIQYRQRRLKDISAQLSTTSNRLKDSKLSKEERKKLVKKQENLKKRFKDIRKEIDSLINSDNLEKVDQLYQDDLKEVEQILQADNISAEDIMTGLKITDHWKNMGIDPSNNGFFTQEELDNPDETVQKVKDQFLKNRQQMVEMEKKLTQATSDLMKQEAFRSFEGELTEELKKKIEETLLDESVVKDLNWLFSNYINISEVDHTVYQTMHQLFKKAETKANEELFQIADEIEEKFKKLTKEQIELMRQKVSNTDPRKTGGITLRFTDEYNSDVAEVYENLERNIEAIEKQDLKETTKQKKIQKAFNKAANSLKNKQMVVDPNKLFTPPEGEFGGNEQVPTKEEVEQHKQELIKHLGSEEAFNMYYNRLKEMIDNYKERLELVREDLENEHEGDEATILKEMEKHRDRYSPFRHTQRFQEGKISSANANRWGFDKENIVAIAKRINEETGEQTGYYDRNFERIQQDTDLRDAYWYTINLIQELYGIAPKHMMEGFDMNTIPDVQKSWMELFAKDGVQKGLKRLHDNALEFTVTSQEETEVEPLEKKVQINGIGNNGAELQNWVESKRIEHFLEHGEEPDSETVRKWTKDKQDELARRQTDDLQKVLKGYAASMIFYKHKASIQDSVSAMHSITDNIIQRAVENRKQQREEKQKFRFKNVENLRNQLDFTVGAFYGYAVKEKSGGSTANPTLKSDVVKASDKQQYKKVNKQIEDLVEKYKNEEISEQSFLDMYNKLSRVKSSLEHEASVATVADALNQYVRIKGIGWNIFSGVANVGFGVVANWLRAADSRVYGHKELRKGYRLVFNSMMKSVTFGAYENATAKKIRNLMDKHDFLKKSKHEIIDRKNSENKNRFGFISPWNLMERGEYMNQAPVMVAMMLRKQVTMNGEQISLWEAFNEDGTFKEGVELPAENFIESFKGSIDRTLSRDHGNYDPTASLKADKHFFTRLLKTFRTWMAQGIYTRWGNERASFTTGTVEKGRWHSWADIFKKGGRPENMSLIETTQFVARQFLNKLWGKTNFDFYVHNETGERIQQEQFEQLSAQEQENYSRAFSEADAANMRANLSEIYMLLSTISFGVALKALTKGIDDDEVDRSATFFNNIVGRVQTDLMMYISPIEFNTILRDPLPLTSLITDSVKLMKHGVGLTLGYQNDIIETGHFAGQSRTWRYSSSLIPGVNMIKRIDSLGKTQNW